MNRHWSYEKNGKTYNDCQAVFERIIDDMEEAASLLPSVWPDPNINWGRPTSAAALGYVAKALHNSASPLFNQYSTGVADYDNELLARCVVACEAVIDEAKSIIGQQPPGMPPGKCRRTDELGGLSTDICVGGWRHSARYPGSTMEKTNRCFWGSNGQADCRTGIR